MDSGDDIENDFLYENESNSASSNSGTESEEVNSENENCLDFNDKECESTEDTEGNGDNINEKSKNNGFTPKKAKDPPRKRKNLKSDSISNKKSKITHKQPSVEELKQIHETQNLFHSNLFRFQIDEMIKEINVSKKIQLSIENWVNSVNKVIEVNEENGVFTFDKLKSYFSNTFDIKYPMNETFFEKFKTQSQRIKFSQPGQLKIGGSFTNATFIGPSLEIDLFSEIPTDIFSLKKTENSFNGNYNQKRAFYLMFIASKIKKNDLIKEIMFSYYGNNQLSPILIIRPNGIGLEKKVTFFVHAVCPYDCIKLSKLIPEACNIYDFEKTPDNQQNTEPTPFYNSIILQDIRASANEEFIIDTLSNHTNVRDAIKLIKIWMKQRNLYDKFIGMNGFSICMIVCYLIINKKISNSMSSYQIIRIFWTFVSQSEWDIKGITLWRPSIQVPPPSIEEFHKHFEVVFTDPSGFYNIFYSLSFDIYNRIRSECKLAINILNGSQNNSFKILFLTKMPYYQQFDHIISVKDNFVEYNLNENKYLSNFKKILEPLRKGYSNRVLSITPFLVSKNKNNEWHLNENPYNNKNTLNFGLILNPENAYDILIKGPQANEHASTEFRSFWGEFSTLRRFQDGSITEAVVLCSGNSSLMEKREITKKITDIIFKRFFESIKYNYISNQIEKTLNISKERTSEDIALSVIKTFDEIGKEVRAINDLPLHILKFQGISSIFRYCDPKPAEVKAVIENKMFISPKIYHGKMQLVQSGKWPNDIEAIKRLKVAYYIKISQHLRQNNIAKCKVHCNGIDVLKNDHVYRISITHPKEIQLNKQEFIENSVKKYKHSPQSLKLEKELELLPSLTGYLRGLYLTNPSFGPTVCLAKNWLYSHYLDSSLFPDECTELIVAYIFLNYLPFYQPNQPQTGFFRFLAFLAETDFINEVIFVNFNEELSKEEMTNIDKMFMASRSNFPPLCMITPCCKENHSIFSKAAPNEQVLARVVLLARHCLEKVEQHLLNDKFDFKILFKDTFLGYNLIIKLRSQEFIRTPAGLDYVENYITELREAYKDIALFFYNPLEPSCIAVLFRPDYMQSKSFKLNAVSGRKFNETTEKLELNTQTLINEMKFIGRGLVLEIENLCNL